MKSILDWIKHNKLATSLMAVLVIILASRFSVGSWSVPRSRGGLRSGLTYPSQLMVDRAEESSQPGLDSVRTMPVEDDLPAAKSEERMVVQTSSLSLKVKEVEPVLNQISSLAEEHGGFMVSSNLTKPEEAASGSIRVRVNSARLEQFLAATKELSVKVVSQHTIGRDITEEYDDLDERLRILQQTKAKFESILDSATRVEDMLQVQRELLQIQRQIDSIKGRQQALEKKVNLSLVTVYLATDELALPYAPDQAWRPNLVFKNAVRSLVKTSRGLVNLGIWMVVYAPYWLTALGVIIVVKKISRSN